MSDRCEGSEGCVVPHNGESSHVERNPRASFEFLLGDGGATADDVTGTRRGLDDETMLIELLEDFPDDLADRLE